MSVTSGLKPLRIWYVQTTDGRRHYFRAGKPAEQYAMRSDVLAIDVRPVTVHRSKDGIVAALNAAAQGAV